jgi:metal-sulfur cluster biosynthetic enzyme
VSPARPTRADLARALARVVDPEVGLDIVTLGLVYHLDVDDDAAATVRLTMTTPACPLSRVIQRQVGAALQTVPGLSRGTVELVWEPAWTPAMVDPAVRASTCGTARPPGRAAALGAHLWRRLRSAPSDAH